MRLNFLPNRIFRETPQVSFFDAGVKGSNGADVVIHHKNAVSPPDDGNHEQYYIHHHQIDHNLVIEGSRTFSLINPEWDEPYHVIFLRRPMGALQIPIGTYDRSQSGPEGSIVLNQATRDKFFDQKKEFSPVSTRSNKQLLKARGADPVYWIWNEGKIKRIMVKAEDSSVKNKIKKFEPFISR